MVYSATVNGLGLVMVSVYSFPKRSVTLMSRVLLGEEAWTRNRWT